MADETAPVVYQRRGRAGHILLNRPHALNALTVDMIRLIDVALETWRDDPAVHLIIVEGSGDRSFCAGGDVRWVRDRVLDDDFRGVDDFFVSEYALNRVIARYNKPYLAVIDGICMGGGVGLSVHGTFRVATEHAVFAMPEAQLGLFPDVGGSYFLPRLRGAYGMYLGLTGDRVGAADACWLGLATHFVPRSAVRSMVDGVSEHGIGALTQFAETPAPPPISAHEDWIDGIFGEPSVEAIMRQLEAVGTSKSDEALRAMRLASPSALQWTFELLRAGAGRTFEECQRAETLLTRHACRHPDFAEGVRAAVVDKDRKPNWRPLTAVQHVSG